jgi:hypothetical protein
VADPTPSQPYTIHEDAFMTTATDPTPARRGGPDPVSLVAGLAAVALALLAMLGVLDTVDPRWVLAGAAVAVGTAVLLTTLRRRSP